MRLRLGAGIFPKTTSVVSVRFTLTAHVPRVNIPATTAASVSFPQIGIWMPTPIGLSVANQPFFLPFPFVVSGKCGHNFHMVGAPLTRLIRSHEPEILTATKHCIMEWIKQDSAKGQCPMCRQSEYPCYAPGFMLMCHRRVRVERAGRPATAAVRSP